jgi:hypothetical protein
LRINTRTKGAKKLPSRDDVHAPSFPSKETQNGQIGVGFHGKTDQVSIVLECICEGLEVLKQCGMGIEIKWRSDSIGYLCNLNIFTV